MKNHQGSLRTTSAFSQALGLLAFFLWIVQPPQNCAAETNIVDVIRAAIATHRALSPAWAAGVSSQTVTDPKADVVADWLRQRSSSATAGQTGLGAVRNPHSQKEAIAWLRDKAGEDVSVHLRPENGTVVQIRGKMLERPAAVSLAAAADRDERTARNFLRSHRALLLLDDPDNELVLTRSEQDDIGQRHLKFSHIYRGVPVWPSDLRVHLDSIGNVHTVDGAYVPTPGGVSVSPVITAADALVQGRSQVAMGITGQATGPELIIYAPIGANPRLAWKMEISVGIAHLWLVIVDATDGKLLLKLNQCMDANVAGSGVDLLGVNRPLNVWQLSGTNYMIDASKPM